jgi:hypothetical protein
MLIREEGDIGICSYIEYRKNEERVNRLLDIFSYLREHLISRKFKSSRTTSPSHVSQYISIRILYRGYQIFSQSYRIYQISRLPCYHALSVSSLIDPDHRYPTCQRLYGYHPKVFFSADAYTCNRSRDDIWKMFVI